MRCFANQLSNHLCLKLTTTFQMRFLKMIELEGPTAGRSQSFEAYEDKQWPLDAGDFNTTLDEQTGQLTVNECHNHQQPKDQQRREKTGKINVHNEFNEKCIYGVSKYWSNLFC